MSAIEKKIPILTSSNYQNYYFKEGVPINSTLHPGRFEHFELQHRNYLKDVISAHRLDFFMVSLITSGKGIQRQGLKDYCVHENMLSFTSPSVISSWKATEGSQAGFSISFSELFFHKGREDKRMLSNLPFFRIDGSAIIALSPDELSEYIFLFRMMDKELHSEKGASPQILRELLSVLLMKAKKDHSISLPVTAPSPASNRLLCLFTDVYMKDIGRIQLGREMITRKISEYAKDIGVSHNHLNDAVREVTGKSAGTLIKEQVIKQATMCLRHSSKSISEIGYLLGFEDPSYFSRYYKKHTGQLPSAVRMSML